MRSKYYNVSHVDKKKWDIKKGPRKISAFILQSFPDYLHNISNREKHMTKALLEGY